MQTIYRYGYAYIVLANPTYDAARAQPILATASISSKTYACAYLTPFPVHISDQPQFKNTHMCTCA
jgi:hypothetical protein